MRSITKNFDDYDYDEKNIKIKFDSDNELPLNKTLEFPAIAIVVRVVFLQNSKYYLQVLLDECPFKI